MVIFPEGTRSYFGQNKLLPFKKGAFNLAVSAQVPVVPIVIANHRNIIDFEKKRYYGGKLVVEVLPPIETKGLSLDDVGELTERTRDAMHQKLIELSK